MFHYDGMHDTYLRFFLAIREAIGCEVSCAEMTDQVNLVLGVGRRTGDRGHIPCFPVSKSRLLCQTYRRKRETISNRHRWCARCRAKRGRNVQPLTNGII